MAWPVVGSHWHENELTRMYHEASKERAKGGVAKPTMSWHKGCWAEKRVYIGQRFASFDNCGCKPRPGFLTCHHHADREEAAQKLKAALSASRCA